jgi:hypothetical protein
MKKTAQELQDETTLQTRRDNVNEVAPGPARDSGASPQLRAQVTKSGTLPRRSTKRKV